MAIKKTIIIEVESEDIDNAKRRLDQLSSSIDTAETNSNLRVDVDDTQIEKAKVSLDQMSSSLDTTSNKANQASASLRGVADNGGAISVLDRITGGLATQLRDGWEASKLFNGSLQKMKGALVASGIGLFIVALALVVTYWEEIKDLVQGTTRALERQQKSLNRLIDRINHQLSLNKLNKEILEKQGKSTVELVRLEKLLLIEKQKAVENSLINLKAQLEIENSKIREVGLLEKGLIYLKGYVFGYATIASDVAKAAGIDIVSDLQGQIRELEIKAAEVKLALLGDGTKPKRTAEGLGEDNALTPEDAKILSSAEILDQKLESIESNAASRRDKSFNEVLNDFEAGIKATSKFTSDIFSLADSLGKQDEKSKEKRARASFAVQKVMNLSLAGIDAVKSIQASLAQSPIAIGPVPNPAGIASLAFASATGAATIAKIATAKFDSGITGVDVGGERGLGASPAAPSFNLVEGTEGNQINESINLGNQEPVQAYVVSGDITTAQNLDNNIITESGL